MPFRRSLQTNDGGLRSVVCERHNDREETVTIPPIHQAGALAFTATYIGYRVGSWGAEHGVLTAQLAGGAIILLAWLTFALALVRTIRRNW